MNYSKSEMEQMRNDAVKRAENMRKQSSTPTQASDESEKKQEPPKRSGAPKKNDIGGLISKIFSPDFFGDDGIILIILLFLLIKEGADKEIIIALIYILL